jgi:hypothetical protein
MVTRRWVYGVAIASCLLGCRDKREHCPSAQTAALHALASTERHAKSAQEAVLKEVDDANPGQVETFKNRFDERIVLAEKELDCQALGKETARGLVPVQTAIDNLVHAADGAPASVVAAVKPIEQLVEQNRALLSGRIQGPRSGAVRCAMRSRS